MGSEAKGVEYEYMQKDLKNKSERLLRSNPFHKKVPVLLHTGKPIAESLVILEHIDETRRKNPLLPTYPFGKATVRFWAKYVDDKCVLSAWMAIRLKGHEQEKAIESAQESLQYLDKLIKGKIFFGGETMGFLDLVVGSLPNWLRFLEEFEGMKHFYSERFPSLHQWFQRFTEIPIIKESVPKTEDLLSYIQAQKNGK